MALSEPVAFEIETVPESLIRSGSFTHVLTWHPRPPLLGSSSVRPLPSVREDRAVRAERKRVELGLAERGVRFGGLL